METDVTAGKPEELSPRGEPVAIRRSTSPSANIWDPEIGCTRQRARGNLSYLLACHPHAAWAGLQIAEGPLHCIAMICCLHPWTIAGRLGLNEHQVSCWFHLRAEDPMRCRSVHYISCIRLFIDRVPIVGVG